MAANNRTVPDVGPDGRPDPEGETDGSDQTRQEGDGTGSDRHRSLELDHVFEILKNQRRRTVLRYLDEHEEPVALGDLAEQVAAIENDTSVAQVTSQERKCAYVGLYQCHLPKMDSMDIVEFNQNRGLIETGPNAALLREYVDGFEAEGRPWPLYYGGVAATGLAAVLVSQFVVGSAIGVTAVAVGLLVCIAAIAVADLRSEQ